MQTEGVVKSVSAAAIRSSFVVQPRHVESALGHSEGEARAAREPQPAEAEPLHDERGSRLLAATRAELEDVIGEAQRLIEERRSAAEAEIAQMRRSADEELARERSEMEQRLRSELQQEYETCLGSGIAAIEALRAELEAERAACLPQLEAEALGLTLELSRSLLLRELSTEPSALMELISASLSRLRPQATALLELDPASCTALSDLLEKNAEGLRLGRWTLQLVADSSLAPGQFRLSEGGRGIDADLPASIDECLGQIAEGSGLEGYETSETIDSGGSVTAEAALAAESADEAVGSDFEVAVSAEVA